MSHRTETGEWPSRIEANNHSSISLLLKKITNEPLPWFGIFALLVIFMTAQSYQAKSSADQANHESWETRTEYMMLREHVDQLRMEMASHGIMPPPLPKCIVEQTPCRKAGDKP